GRLVAGAAGGVEDGLVRGGQGVDLLGDDVEGALPGDRLVVVAALGQVHRVRQPPLLPQPVAAAAGQVGHRVPGEELRRDPAQRGLLGHRLRAVLAELRPVRVLRLRPGAARAVEAVLLVDVEQRQRRAPHAHLLVGHAQGVPDRGEPGRRSLRLADLRRVLNRITLGRFRGHRALPFAYTCDVPLSILARRGREQRGHVRAAGGRGPPGRGGAGDGSGVPAGASAPPPRPRRAPAGASGARRGRGAGRRGGAGGGGGRGGAAGPGGGVARGAWGARWGGVSVGRGRIGGVAETASKKTDQTSGAGRPRLMLMDGHSLAYRAFFALPAENFTTATGQPTNAIYGFASTLRPPLRDAGPTHCAPA